MPTVMSPFMSGVGSNASKRTVSIIGAGPSGFFTAYRLLTKSPVPVHVTLWEKLPVPFGLSRFGVAPDHPEVKNCEATFTSCANEFLSSGDANDKNTFEFNGGVDIGGQVSLKKLIASQDAVVFSYGCSGDKKLGIPGEDGTMGVFSSREFVNWYNGHPKFAISPKFESFDWQRVRDVGIIGNGNVALDLARMLLSNKIGDIWNQTDISPIALEKLRNAPIRNVKIIGRRDFTSSKFTNKELRELWELEKYGIKGKISNQYFNEQLMDNWNAQFKNDRAMNRRIEMCSEFLKDYDQRTKKNYKKHIPGKSMNISWELDYLKSPIEIRSSKEGNIESLVLSQNAILPGNRIKEDPNKPQIEYPLDLLITSLGYAGKPLKEFEELSIGFEKGHIANEKGRVLNRDTKEIIPNLYGTGWIRKGSQGVIASTMMDAFDVGDTIIKDLQTNSQVKQTSQIDLTDIKHTTWKDWEKINAEELAQGQQHNKSRLKLVQISKMYDVINK